MSTPLPISLVVPTFNRNRILKRTLPSFLAQDVSEILLVNDGGKEDPTEVIQELGCADVRLRVVNLSSNRGSPAARNAGGDAARGEFVLFVDDDVVLAKNYAALLHAHLKEQHADLAAGRRIWLRRGETLEQALRGRTRCVPSEHLVNRRHIAFDDEADFDADTVVPLIGAILMVRRSLLKQVRYEEVLYRRTGWREETDFQIQAARAGARAIACPHALCHHLSKEVVGRAGGQRAGRLVRYEWFVFRNNVQFLRRHFKALRDDLGFEPGPGPVLGALRAYLMYRVPSKLRHLMGRDGP
jgi:glycosyltransferase involved in cell wall biosynthesis